MRELVITLATLSACGTVTLTGFAVADWCKATRANRLENTTTEREIHS